MDITIAVTCTTPEEAQDVLAKLNGAVAQPSSDSSDELGIDDDDNGSETPAAAPASKKKAKKKASKKKAKKKAAKKEEPAGPTFDEVKEKLAEFNDAFGLDEAKKLVEHFGALRISALEESRYAEFVAAVPWYLENPDADYADFEFEAE